MSRLVPVGYLTFREAVIGIEHAMFAGIPDRVVVAKLRQAGDDVADGEANRRAVSELWKGVDARKLKPVAIGGHPRQKVKLTAEQIKGIPELRTCGDFSFLRPRNSLYRQLVAWFGLDLASVTLAFQERELEKFCGLLRRNRRRTIRSDKTPSGRRSLQVEVAPIILDLVATKKWTTAQSLKSLTQKVNQKLWTTARSSKSVTQKANQKLDRPLSEDTVTRCLDQLYEETGDRSLQRRRRRRP
jgi:hypothetical protein